MSTDSVLDDILAAAESLSVSAAPPASRGVSPRPMGYREPRRGGYTEGIVPGKLFSIINLDCSDGLYCFGVIGNGSAFCIKRNCGVKAHANSKVTFSGLTDSFVFIRRNIPGTVFCEPKLSTAKIPKEIMSDWESKTLTFDDWLIEFQAVDGTADPLTSVEEFHVETDFLSESTLARTPSKRRKDSFSGEEYQGMLPGWKHPKYDRSLPEDESSLEVMINEGIRKRFLTTTVSKIESYIDGMGGALSEVTAIHHDRLVSVEDDLEVMIGVVQTIKARTGTAVDLGDRFSAPTLWGSTAAIAGDLSKITKDFDDIQRDVILPLANSVADLEATDEDLKAKTEKVVKVASLLLNRVQVLTDTLQEVKTDLVLIRAEQGAKFKSVLESENSDPSDDLMDFIMSEEQGAATPLRRRSGGNLISPAAPVTPPQNDPDDPDHDDSVRSILSKLMDEVKILQSSKQNAVIKFGNLGITDLSDCAAWIDVHFKGYHYGLIMDPLLMLDRIYGDEEVGEGGGALLKSMELQYKMKIESGSEAAALNALRFSRPRVFHKGRPTIVSVQNKSRLNLLPSHADWNPGGEGVMDYCITKMNLLEDSISDEIGHTFGIESTAHWIATKCLSSTVSFLTQMFGCVESIYKRLHNFSKFTTEQAWSLTTQVLDRILADLFIPKDNILQSLKSRNTPTTCAQVLLAAFKTHDIMSVYVSHKFENHPSVSTEYVKFLATNSGSEKVVKLGEALESMKSKVSGATDEAKAATKKADIAGSKIADLIKEVATLSQKVKNLESRK